MCGIQKNPRFIVVFIVMCLIGMGQSSFGQTKCDILIKTISYQEIVGHHNVNSRLLINNDTIDFSLDPILTYNLLKVDSNTTRYHNVYDAVAMVNVFEAMATRQDIPKKDFFLPYISTAKELLCQQISSDTLNGDKLKKMLHQDINNAILDYARAYHYNLKSSYILRGSPLIKVKFVSTPSKANIRYILNGYVLANGNQIPENLWTYAADGEVIELHQSTIYTIQTRWNKNAPWQQQNKEMTKNGDITIIPINKEN